MTRADFQKLAQARLRDSRVLLRSRRFSSAYYIVGYAIECALKARIAKRTRRYEFPDRRSADLYVHNLPKLLVHAELERELQEDSAADGRLGTSWDVVKDWNEEARYKEASEREAGDMGAAAEYVLAWIQSRW